MKISLNWLKEFVELPPTSGELISLLTMAGIEVEGIQTRGCEMPNLIVAEIKESIQHPNADRLRVCQVNDGSENARQIVCGAKNFLAGDKVPLALPGAKLGPDFVIKVSKLRGVESQGMLCSAEEIGLSPSLGARGAEDGLLILPADAKPGTPIAQIFQADTVLDLEITPNRPDLLGVIGIAREVAALTGKAFGIQQDGEADVNFEKIHVENSALCPLYTAHRISDVKIAASPEWLRGRLESAGLRSVNNIVDITNFIMLETGQPLHAFDADKLEGALQVRLAKPGEEFLALDGKSYKLTGDQLVIADQKKALAIAGIMGGEETGVTQHTVNVVLESACFQPQNIRKTARNLGLSSDSSYRFERGVDIQGVRMASERALRMILEIAGGRAGEIAAAGTENTGAARQAIPLRVSRVTSLLGVEVTQARVEQILEGFSLKKSDKGWIAPSFRRDLVREIDLIEEIARVIGMEVIPAKMHARFAPESCMDRSYDRAMLLRRAFAAQGFYEARSITLVPAEPLGLGCTRISPENLLRVKNPMIEEQVVLRPNLLHGLLSAVRENIRVGAVNVRLFEIGRVFSACKPEESLHLAAVWTGALKDRTWRDAKNRAGDLFDFKAILNTLFGDELTFERDANPAVALSVVLKMRGNPCGFAGQLLPTEARDLDASEPVLFAEIDLAALWKMGALDGVKKYREISRFPAITRDIAMLAPLALSHKEITDAFLEENEPLLESAEIFDVFTDASGVKIPADKKSLAYSLIYRSAERTLTSDEANAAHLKIKEKLRSLGVDLRE